jgi:hypothetical protein
VYFIKDISIYTKGFTVVTLEDPDNIDSPLVDVRVFDNAGIGTQTEEYITLFEGLQMPYNLLAYPTLPDVEVEANVLGVLRTWNMPDQARTKLQKQSDQFPFVLVTFLDVLDGAGANVVSEVYDTLEELQADPRIKPNVVT